MKPSDIQTFERFASRVLRRGLSGMRKITDVLRKAPSGDGGATRILVVKLWGLGALVCATPAMAAIRQMYPDARITLLTSRGMETLYEGTDLFDEAIPWDVGGLRELPATIRNFRRSFGENQFDLAINLDGLSEFSTLLTQLARARVKAGFSRPGGSSRNYSVHVPLDLGNHATKACLALAKELGATETSSKLISPRLKTTELEKARMAISDYGVEPETKLIGINMNSSEFAQRRAWPPEKFLLLAQAIEEMGGYKTVFIGSSEEDRFVSRHIKQMDAEPINLAGRTSIRQLACVIKQMHLLITNDSGPMHLAAALDVPTVGIFGPESPERFGTPKTERHATVWARPECGPCVSFLGSHVGKCEHGESCIRDISIDTVRAAVEDMLDHLSDPQSPPWLA